MALINCTARPGPPTSARSAGPARRMASFAAGGRPGPRPSAPPAVRPSPPRAAAVDEAEVETRPQASSGANPPVARPAPPAGGPTGPSQPRRSRPARAPGPSSGAGEAKEPAGSPIDPEAYPPGRVVVARVIKVSKTGVRVRLLHDDAVEGRVYGFVRDNDRPRGWTAGGAGPPGRGPALHLPIGTVREFVVSHLTKEAAASGVGPALSARTLDDDVRWARVHALATACRCDHETVEVEIEGSNAGGLVTRLCGLPAFIPYSQVDLDALVGTGNRPGWDEWSAAATKERARREAAGEASGGEEGEGEEAGEASSSSGAAAAAAAPSTKDGKPGFRPRGGYLTSPAVKAAAVGKVVAVSPFNIDRERGRIVLSMRRAREARTKATLAIGSLVWGTVRRVEPFGLFVGLDGTKESALLHVSNISRVRTAAPGDVFAAGARVRALIVGMDAGAKRISLSTAELEAEDGDIHIDPEAVFAGAEEQARVFLEHLDRLAAGGGGGRGGEEEEGGFGGGGYKRGGGSGGGGGGGGYRKQGEDVPPLDW